MALFMHRTTHTRADYVAAGAYGAPWLLAIPSGFPEKQKIRRYLRDVTHIYCAMLYPPGHKWMWSVSVFFTFCTLFLKKS